MSDNMQIPADLEAANSILKTIPYADRPNLSAFARRQLLAEARRQTKADALAAALRELILAGCPCGHVDAEHCEFPEKAECPFSSARAALAAYEGIAK